LVRDHARSRETRNESAKRLFEAIDPKNRESEARLRPRINHWIKTTEWFVKRAHDRGEIDEKMGDKELKERFEIFERALFAMVGGFFKAMEELDAILEEATPEQVDKTVVLLVHDEQYRYFFDRLENPEWIEPLWGKGFFRQPPKPIQDEEEGTIRFPPWPEARYLARMAKHKPEIVADIIQDMDDTDNVAVHSDLLDAMLSMPPDLSVRLVEKAVHLAKSPYILTAEKFGQLISRLAKGEKTHEAMTIAEDLLDIFSDSKRVEAPGPGKTFYPSSEPQARFDSWEYEQILKKYFPDLVQKAGIAALELLCNLLDKAIQIHCYGEVYWGTEDYSRIWRPAIEDHPQNCDGTIKDALVSAVRDTAEIIIRSEQATVEEVVNILETKRWKVFRRIALHTLRLFPDQAEKLATARLTDRSLFEDVGLRHEYVLLLQNRFPHLAPKEQAVILGWIKNGPEVDQWKQWWEREAGQQPSEEDITRYREIWQRDWLARIGPDNLPEEWKKRYHSLCKKYGKPDHPEFPVYMESWVGPTSPKTAEELKSMSITDIVKFLSTWKPPEIIFREPSPEGLGRSLSAVVAEDPERFASEAKAFQGLDPTYVRAVIFGLWEALKHDKVFNWQPVLDLCAWVLSQPREVPNRRVREMEADPDWGWTRKAIADLFSAGFEHLKGSIPITLRRKVWAILQPLTEDSDPTPEHEHRYGGSNMDPATLSINTVRGAALHAVIHYALWVRRYLEQQPDGKDRLQKGFEEMPEVREVLETHLDPLREQSLAIRAVYGQRFPWLVLLDPEWAKANAERIFPMDLKDEAFFEAAWDTYVMFCKPYDNVWEILRPFYRLAVERIGGRQGNTRWLANPEEKLAEHLMVFYWRGKLSLDDDLLVDFWRKAPASVRAHAHAFVGQALKQTSGDVPLEILNRLKQLWERRLTAARQAQDRSDFEKEVAAFGWWFASGKFDVDWALDQLFASLEFSGRVKRTHMILKTLSVTAQTHPLKSVKSLRLIAEGDRQGWELDIGREHIWQILQWSLANPDAKEEAEKLIHYLGSRGFLEFKDLLTG
jgi:hypothetical protein